MWPFDSTPSAVASADNPNPALQLAGVGSPAGDAASGFASGGDSTAPGWSDKLGKALQDLSKSKLAQPPDSSSTSYAPKPDIPGPSSGQPMHRQSLDAIVQLLQKQQAQYGELTGQPVQRPQFTGLLGF